MKILLIDNYDSFTYNLYQLVYEVFKEPPIVKRNDELTWEEINQLHFDAVIISPGPGRPDIDCDFGVCKDIIECFDNPILGVCLGFQGICISFGGEVINAKKVAHGITSKIEHNGSILFDSIPQGFEATRYHSFIVEDFGSKLKPTAWTEDEILMGVEHPSRPIFGVQFHPESICSEYGEQLIRNFKSIVEQHGCNNINKTRATVNQKDLLLSSDNLEKKSLKIFSKKVFSKFSSEEIFLSFFSKSKNCFWLDGENSSDENSFSYMGDTSGPLGRVIEYDACTKVVNSEIDGSMSNSNQTIFSFLDEWFSEYLIESKCETHPSFIGGWVGYLGYEVRGDCGGILSRPSDKPDAGLIFADRFFAFDHRESCIWIICCDNESDEERALQWIFDTEFQLSQISGQCVPHVAEMEKLSFVLDNSLEEYQELIEKAKDSIHSGDSYEVCLTNEFVAKLPETFSPLDSYRKLRKTNYAPYCAYLCINDTTILSSSPERFLRIKPDGRVDSKPIKGTLKRSKNREKDLILKETLRNSAKDRSENMMIVDLVRNDLGRVCEFGSVKVDKLFDVESFATVHQLVSTISGKIRPEISTMKCIQSLFPGGSMVGAPKLRTMEIIDDLEKRSRGAYSGAIGYFSLSGDVHLSITIRTAVIYDDEMRIGAGGAIIDLSSSEDEIQEIRLKFDSIASVFSGEFIE